MSITKKRLNTIFQGGILHSEGMARTLGVTLENSDILISLFKDRGAEQPEVLAEIVRHALAGMFISGKLYHDCAVNPQNETAYTWLEENNFAVLNKEKNKIFMTDSIRVQITKHLNKLGNDKDNQNNLLPPG
jgi:hypothetical protein